MANTNTIPDGLTFDVMRSRIEDQSKLRGFPHYVYTGGSPIKINDETIYTTKAVDIRDVLESSFNANLAIRLGNPEQTRTYPISIGSGAKSSAYGAVQIGKGENNVANTLKFMNRTVVDADGKISADTSISSDSSTNSTKINDYILKVSDFRTNNFPYYIRYYNENLTSATPSSSSHPFFVPMRMNIYNNNKGVEISNTSTKITSEYNFRANNLRFEFRLYGSSFYVYYNPNITTTDTSFKFSYKGVTWSGSSTSGFTTKHYRIDFDLRTEKEVSITMPSAYSDIGDILYLHNIDIIF